METNERLIAISEYLKEQYVCKMCGQEILTANVSISKTQFNNGKVQFSASCPDCDRFIRWMPTSIIGKVWYKGSMQEIASFDTGMLQWMLRVGYGSNKKVQENIKKVLFSRIDKPEVMNFRPNTKEETLLKQIAILKDGIPVIEEKHYAAQNKLVRESVHWSYHQVERQKKIVLALYKNMTNAWRELDKIKKLLADIKENSATLG